MKKFIFFVIFFLAVTDSHALSLDEEIANMKTAPQEQRYELMNNIKKRIASLNGAKRAEAIAKFGHGKHNGAHNNLMHNTPLMNAQEQHKKQTGLQHEFKPVKNR